MLLSDFDYNLPPELIAQYPLAQRDASRMLLLDRKSGMLKDDLFRQVSECLQPKDLVVFNNTKVFPARLIGRRKGLGSQVPGKNNPTVREFLTSPVELLLVNRVDNVEWEGLVHPGRKVRLGEVLVFGNNELFAEVTGREDYGLRRVRLSASEGSVEQAIDRLGHIPLPPYLHRPEEPEDREHYQTVYARVRGSAAAPTAGLHFTPAVFEALHTRGIETCEITLHVGLGTFQPVRTPIIEGHAMHAERYHIAEAAAEAILRAQAEARRIIAIGTTTVRALEHVARLSNGRVRAGSGEADLFIYPGFHFQVVQGLLTNFHLPRSTLLMLVCAFAGCETVLRAYRHAVQQRYRFYSYGDCMLIL
jgi:S-adenosylmethionine:tRNA ribosyltransferase-isomerase